MQHGSATDGVTEIRQRGESPQDEPVAAGEDRLLGEEHPAVPGASGRDFGLPVKEDSPDAGEGPRVEGDLAPVAQRLGDQRKVLDENFRGLRGGERPGVTQDRPARRVLLLDPLQVHRGAGPRGRSIHRAAVDLEPAHLRDRPSGEDRHLLARCDRPADHRSRDHGAEPLHHKDAIDRQAEQALGRPYRHIIREAIQNGNELGNSFLGH